MNQENEKKTGLLIVRVYWDRSGRDESTRSWNEYVITKNEVPTFYGNLSNTKNNFLMFTTFDGIKIIIQKARIRDVSIAASS